MFYTTNTPIDNHSILLRTRGACLDCDASPVRIPEGSTLLAHPLPLTIEAAAAALGRVVCVKCSGGNWMKHLTAVDEEAGTLCLTMYNPERITKAIPLKDISVMFVADGVWKTL